jgi:hypothetical protein
MQRFQSNPEVYAKVAKEVRSLVDQLDSCTAKATFFGQSNLPIDEQMAYRLTRSSAEYIFSILMHGRSTSAKFELTAAGREAVIHHFTILVESRLWYLKNVEQCDREEIQKNAFFINSETIH